MSVLKKLGVSSKLQKKKYSQKQEQTKECFSYKWSRTDTYESEAKRKATRDWLFEKYCNHEPERLSSWLSGGRKIILDAGCGAGQSALLFFGDHLKDHDYLGADISDAIDLAKIRFQECGYKGEFLRTDLLDLDLPDDSIDLIFSEGVLHHTDSTENTFKFLARKLKPGGRFLFYIYAKKAVIREFTDDCIREELMSLNDEEAWRALEPLTRFGIALGRLNIDLDVPEDIPYLGIKKGKIDLQRFFYWNVCKMYYRPEFTFDEMNHINFDWFRPLNCHRHTPEEVRQWCADIGFFIEHLRVEESGISVVAWKATPDK